MLWIKHVCDINVVVYVTLYKLYKSTVTLFSLSVAPFDIDGNRTKNVSQENCPALICCPVLGNPEPNITWYNANDPSTIIIKATTLELPQTVCNRGGWYTYTCFAENHLGNVSATVKVLVGKL